MPRRKKALTKQEEQERLEKLIAEVKPNPAVLDLPLPPTDHQKVWWNQFIGDQFRSAVKSKGKKSANGVTWVRDIFIDRFCEELYPTLTPEERKQYYRLVGERFYQYLTNHTNNSTPGISIKEPHVKFCAYGYDVWRHEKPDEFQRMKEEYVQAHPECNEDNVGNRRSLYAKLFKLLPASVQADYKARAQEELKAAQAVDLLFGNDRNLYNANIPRRLKAFMKEVEMHAKARINAQLLTEDGDGNFTITSVASDSLKEFQTSAEVGRMLRAMKVWVEKTVANGKPVDGGAPDIAVYGDESKDMFPYLPDYAGVTLVEAQKLLRTYITMVWMFSGGVGKVPWEEISNAIEEWVDPERMPVGAEWKDPSSLSLAAVLVWLDYFSDCQNGTIPLKNRFQFRRVVAGLRPIRSSLSQEASRELVRRTNKDTWVFTFDETVTKCHQPNGMRYSDAGKAYAEFIATGNCSSQSHPPNWNGLPGGSDSRVLIDDGTTKAISNHVAQLPEDVRELVTKLLDVLAKHQSHNPASNMIGPWADKSPLPALLPNPPPADFPTSLREFIIDFWIPVSYFLAPAAPGDVSTIAFYEAWQQKLLASGVLHHEPSGTMLGGHSGVVWVVVSLIKLVLNFAALRGDIPRPVELPAGSDETRLPLGEWAWLLGWCRNWIAKLENDIQVLSQTSEERRNSSSNQPPVPSTSAPALPPDPTATSQSSGSKKTRPKMKAKAPARNSRNDSDDSEDPGDDNKIHSDSDDEGDVDYDKLDAHADSDDEPNDDEPSDGEPSNTGMGDDSDTWGGVDDALPPLVSTPPNPAPSVPSSSRPPSSSVPPPSVPHVFGPFRSLPVFKKWPPLPKDYNGVVAAVKKCDTDITVALRAWYELGANNEKLDVEASENAAALKTSLPTDWRPLVDFVRTASMAWRRASTTAPSIFQSAFDFSMLVRQSVPYTAAAHRFRDISEMIENDQWDLVHLEELENRLNKGLAEVRWLSKELVAFEQLSSEWSVKLVSNWPLAEILNDPVIFKKFAALLLKWAEEADRLENTLISSREQLWKELGGPLDMTRSRARPWYRFGCPGTAGQLDSLKACLKAASAVDTAALLGPSRAGVHPGSSSASSVSLSTTGGDATSTTSPAVDTLALLGANQADAPPGSSRTVPVMLSTVGDDAMDTSQVDVPEPPTVQEGPAQYGILTAAGNIEVPKIPMALIEPANTPEVTHTLVANAPSPDPTTPVATTPLFDPPSTKGATKEAGSTDKPAAQAKKKGGRKGQQPLASDVGSSTRRSTRSSNAAAEPADPAPGNPRASKRVAEAANGSEEPQKAPKRRKTGRK